MSTGEGIWLDLPTFLDLEVGPPRRLYVFNPATLALERVGSAGGGGGPLILPGDPPDFVTTEEGDLIIVEGDGG